MLMAECTAAAAATTLNITPARDGTAGVAQNITVTARDPFGNVASGYRGTLN